MVENLTLEEMISLTEKVKEWKGVGSTWNPYYSGTYSGEVDKFKITLQKFPAVFPILRSLIPKYLSEVEYVLQVSTEGNRVGYDHAYETTKLSNIYESAVKNNEKRLEETRQGNLSDARELVTS